MPPRLHGWRVWQRVAAVVALAAVHLALTLSAFGYAYALGEADAPVPAWLVVANAVLGFPALVVVPPSVMIALRPWLGDDANGLFLLFALNGLFWGTVLVTGTRALCRRRRRPARSGHQPVA